MQIMCMIQARMGSTRLPRKVLKPLLDKPLLWWDVYRLRQSRLIDEIIIATTTNNVDDDITNLCATEGWLVYRGSEDDVLDRYYQAAQMYNADVVVRVTSDCPLIDPIVLDYTLSAYLSASPTIDYASNIVIRSYPRGLDVEVFGVNALESAWQNDESPWREHVTPYIYNNPDQFRLLSVKNPVDYSHHRWTVDTSEDFELIERIYNHFGHGDFGWQDVLGLMDANPDWYQINAHIEQKKV